MKILIKLPKYTKLFSNLIVYRSGDNLFTCTFNVLIILLNKKRLEHHVNKFTGPESQIMFFFSVIYSSKNRGKIFND